MHSESEGDSQSGSLAVHSESEGDSQSGSPAVCTKCDSGSQSRGTEWVHCPLVNPQRTYEQTRLRGDACDGSER